MKILPFSREVTSNALAGKKNLELQKKFSTCPSTLYQAPPPEAPLVLKRLPGRISIRFILDASPSGTYGLPWDAACSFLFIPPF